MNAIKVDEANRIQIPLLRPGDYYEPEAHGENELILRKVPPPRHRLSYDDALAAIERSPLRFTKNWDEIKNETR